MSLASQGGYFEAASVDARELDSILRDLKKISNEFKGGRGKVSKILKTAAKPLREDMKS